MLATTPTVEISMQIAQKTKDRIPFDPAMPLLSIFPKELKDIILE